MRERPTTTPPRHEAPAVAHPPTSGNCACWGAVALLDATGHPVRLPTRAGTLLLARLALAPQRQHPREELVELLWPGVDGDAGRNRLRQALSVLRTLLEPTDAEPVLQADRRAVWLMAGALDSDVHAFGLAVARGDAAAAARASLNMAQAMPLAMAESAT